MLYRRSIISMIGIGGITMLAGCVNNPLGEGQPLDFEAEKSGDHRSTAIEEDRPNDVRWYHNTEEAMDALDELNWAGDVERNEVEEFISEMEDGEELVDIRSRGPSLGDELEIEDLMFDEDAIWGRATVNVEEGLAPGEDSFPTVIIRFEVTEDLPRTIRIEITDGWDETREVTVERE